EMKALTLACLILFAASGCDDEGPPARTLYPLTDPQPQPRAQAAADARLVERLATATCDREQSCGTIGPGAYFETREQCLRSVRDQSGATFNATACPAGIDLKAFESCLASLEATQCAQPGDAITRAARCPASEMCLK
ncbi:MAG TPA: DUF6184 family natural product biosynthesis lipoprotein, partial [Polyangiaceae bacterium]|nr:DUF6184 family natural product biosynthesis lipoprotein [Polyangiaceae bacterium]